MGCCVHVRPPSLRDGAVFGRRLRCAISRAAEVLREVVDLDHLLAQRFLALPERELLGVMTPLFARERRRRRCRRAARACPSCTASRSFVVDRLAGDRRRANARFERAGGVVSPSAMYMPAVRRSRAAPGASSDLRALAVARVERRAERHAEREHDRSAGSAATAACREVGDHAVERAAAPCTARPASPSASAAGRPCWRPSSS